LGLEDQEERPEAEMEKEIYHRLARQLDTLPIGFPATRSWVELELLGRLFSPEEAVTPRFVGRWRAR
jgi:hypothetical protein